MRGCGTRRRAILQDKIDLLLVEASRRGDSGTTVRSSEIGAREGDRLGIRGIVRCACQAAGCWPEREWCEYITNAAVRDKAKAVAKGKQAGIPITQPEVHGLACQDAGRGVGVIQRGQGQIDASSWDIPLATLEYIISCAHSACDHPLANSATNARLGAAYLEQRLARKRAKGETRARACHASDLGTHESSERSSLGGHAADKHLRRYTCAVLKVSGTNRPSRALAHGGIAHDKLQQDCKQNYSGAKESSGSIHESIGFAGAMARCRRHG